VKRPAGRPPLDPTAPSILVSVALTRRLFDEARRRAALEDVSVPEIMRRALSELQNKKIKT
jgi:hypothetical protein